MSDDANALLEAVLDGNSPSDTAESSPAKEVATEDTANDSKVETTVETKEEATEEVPEVPFHKHPKFQRLFNENKEYAEKNKVLEERLQRFEETLNEIRSGKTDEVPEEFSELVGSNPKAYKLLEKFVEEKSQKILAQAEQKRIQESQAVNEAEKRIIAQFDEIADVDDSFTESKRNEVLSLMNEAAKNDSWLAPKQAYKIWKQMNDAKISQPNPSKEVKRQAAAKTTSSNRADDERGITSEDIGKMDKQSLLQKFMSLNK